MKYKNNTGHFHSFLTVGALVVLGSAASMPSGLLLLFSSSPAILSALLFRFKEKLPLSEEIQDRIERFRGVSDVYQQLYINSYIKDKQEKVIKKLGSSKINKKDTIFLSHHLTAYCLSSFDSSHLISWKLFDSYEYRMSDEFYKAYKQLDDEESIHSFLNNSSPSIRQQITSVVDATEQVLKEDGLSLNFAILSSTILGFDKPLAAFKSSYKLSDLDRELINSSLKEAVKKENYKNKFLSFFKALVTQMVNKSSIDEIGKNDYTRVYELKEIKNSTKVNDNLLGQTLYNAPHKISSHFDPYLVQRFLQDNDEKDQNLILQYLQVIDPVLSNPARTEYKSFLEAKAQKESLESAIKTPIPQSSANIKKQIIKI